jgi:hypothetical protein
LGVPLRMKEGNALGIGALKVHGSLRIDALKEWAIPLVVRCDGRIDQSHAA